MTATLGNRLKALIKESGMEQQQVAAALGLKTSTFNGYVGSKRKPPIEFLKKFADYFDVSIDYLVGYSDIRDPYLRHLSSELNAFVLNPENKVYLELAMDIKKRTENENKKVQSIP